MQNPFFTIIIVVFNGEKTLQRSIDSIISQTYRNFELLIIDGLSTDGTMKIVHGKVANDDRIRFVSEKDNGIYDAMNKAIGLARGEWLYFLGGNDWLHDSNILQTVSEELKKEPVDLLYGNVMMEPFTKPYDGLFTFNKLLRRNISHQAIFYKRNLFDRIGNYNLSYKLHADWDLNIRCFREPGVTNRHINATIASFAKGGISSGHDKIFLKEVIIPMELEKLAAAPRLLKNIKKYDEYWRLFRNTGLNDPKELNENLPSGIINMLKSQRTLPDRLFRKGFFSKFFMGLSYIRNLFTKTR